MRPNGSTPRWTVGVVDDDESVRESLPDLLRALGYDARAFPSAHAFFAADVGSLHGLVLDVAMPEMSGPELWQVLRSRGFATPVIFVTAQRDEVVRRRLMDQGAIECLFKPFSDIALARALRMAIGEGA